MLHPECQRKAQAELERVIGKGRLPTLEDRDQLPYITAIFRESMRFVHYFPFHRYVLTNCSADGALLFRCVSRFKRSVTHFVV